MAPSQEERVDISDAKLKDKITSIRKLVRSLEMRFSGYEWSGKGEHFVYRGKPLCGQSVISKAVGLLNPFTEETNLLTSKDPKVFAKQKWRASTIFNNICLNDNTLPDDNFPTVLEIFRDTLQNIGDVILTSRGTMNKIFSTEGEEREATEY